MMQRHILAFQKDNKWHDIAQATTSDKTCWDTCFFLIILAKMETITG